MQCELQVLVIVYHAVHNGKSVNVDEKMGNAKGENSV